MDLIESNSRWFFEANQQPVEPEPNATQVGFYIGMQCEELAEKIAAVSPADSINLKLLGQRFKAGEMNERVLEAMADPDRVEELLDGDVDLLWVTIGGARAQGADIMGAYGAVNDANYAKRWPDGKFHNDPATGKVLKPAGWAKPDLKPFIHPALQGAQPKEQSK